MYGYVIYFCGIPIAWTSKGMKSVVLSTNEGEYMALSRSGERIKIHCATIADHEHYSGMTN